MQLIVILIHYTIDSIRAKLSDLVLGLDGGGGIVRYLRFEVCFVLIIACLSFTSNACFFFAASTRRTCYVRDFCNFNRGTYNLGVFLKEK